MPSYYSRPSDRIADLLLRRGDIEAEAARASGNIWGSTVANLGQQASGYFADRAQRKSEEERAALQEKRLGAIQESFNDPEVWGDPRQAIQRLFPLLGPDTFEVVKGMQSFRGVQEAPDPEKAMPLFREAVGAYSRVRDPAVRQILRPGITQQAVGLQLAPQEELDSLEQDQFDALAQSFLQPQEGPEYGSAEHLASIQDPAEREAVLANVQAAAGAERAPQPTLAEEIERRKALKRADLEVERAMAPPDQANQVLDAYLTDLKEGQLIWSDIPSEMKDAVRVAAQQQDIPIPTKAPKEDTIAELADAQDLLARTSQLLASPTGVQEWAKTTIIPDWVTQMAGWGSAAKANRSDFFLYMAETLKSIQGSRPSDKDMQWYMENLPRQADPPQVAQEKIQRIQTRLTRRYNNRIRGLRDNGYALRGFSEIGVPAEAPMGTDEEPPDA